MTISAEMIEHFDNDSYQKHTPILLVIEDRANGPWRGIREIGYAEDGDDGSYWTPSEPYGNGNWSDSWCEVVTESGETYPACSIFDTDGYDHMMERYDGQFVYID